MRRVSAFTLFTLTTLSANEPSAFLAGDLNQKVPYGLTKNEQIIHEQKVTIDSLKKKQRVITSKLSQLEQSVEGMRSLFEGVSEQDKNTKNSIRAMFTEVQTLVASKQESEEKIQTLQKRIETLQQSLELYAKEQSGQIESLKNLMRQMSGMIDSINGSYVDSSRFNQLEKDFNDFKTIVANELKNIAASVTQPEDLSTQENFSVFEKAKKLHAQKDYRRAIKYFEHLIKNHFKPATSNYYIGESYFSLKEYPNAITYYKESAKRYDKSSFMPILLLHTAQSFHRIRDHKNAKQFYNALIAKFPESKESNTAKKMLEKLK